MRMTCSFSHFTTGEKRQVFLSMFKKLPRWGTDNLFRCYEKSIIDQEISKMRRTKEWEETKQSILSAKELVRFFFYFSLMFFFLYCVLIIDLFPIWKKHCQRHNGPKGWVGLPKVTYFSHITCSNTKFDQISSSEYWSSTNFKILTSANMSISTQLKIQHID